MRVSSCRDEQECAPQRAVQFRLVDVDRLARQVREHRQRIAELAAVDAAQEIVDRIRHR